MNDETIENVWCMVATPFRAESPTSEREINGEKKERRVSGAKGLGRLSVARLGGKLELFTKQKDSKAWRVMVEWDTLADADNLAQCTAFMRLATPSEFSADSGTLLRITQLRSDWPESEIDELEAAPDFEQEYFDVSNENYDDCDCPFRGLDLGIAKKSDINPGCKCIVRIFN